MDHTLSIYLQDHLAGAEYAINLVEFLREHHKNEDLANFGEDLLTEIKEDHSILRQIAERAGRGASTGKNLMAQFTEKISRLKLRHAGNGLGTFEALEFLALGIYGKLALWDALSAVASSDPRLRGIDFEQMSSRAKRQHAEVEKWRLQLARKVFGASSVRKRPDRRTVRESPTSNRNMQLAGAVALTLAGAAIIGLGPDLVRYMKIRAM